MKKLILGRVVPTMPAKVSWLIFGMTVWGVPFFPKFASSRSTRANRFSLELNNWSTRSSSILMFLARRCATNSSLNGSVANSERAGTAACVLGGSYAAMPKIVWMNWRCATASPLATQRT